MMMIMMILMFQDSEFYLDEMAPEDIEEELQRTEAEFWKRMQSCRIQSRRLVRAKASPKAKGYFERPVDEREGYDQMWVSAIDNVCFKSLVGNFRNYGEFLVLWKVCVCVCVCVLGYSIVSISI
jgi:hypothetical protein